MAKTEKPNILVIWGDDIGISNLSCYSHGIIQPMCAQARALQPRLLENAFTDSRDRR